MASRHCGKRFLSIVIFVGVLFSAFGSEVEWEPEDKPHGKLERRLIKLLDSKKVDEALSLLDQPVKLNIRHKGGMTPLVLAIFLKSKPLVEKMLANGAKPDFQSRITYMNVGTPLSAACLVGDIEIVNLLLKKGADVKGKPNHLVLEPVVAAIMGKKRAVLELLLDKGISPNRFVFFEHNHPLLHVAIMLKNKEIVELLLNRGARVNEVDSKGITPLALAKKHKQKEVIKLLKRKGAKEKLSNKELATTIWEKEGRGCIPDAKETRSAGKKLENLFDRFCQDPNAAKCKAVKNRPSRRDCALAGDLRNQWELSLGKKCGLFDLRKLCRHQWYVEFACQCGIETQRSVSHEFWCKRIADGVSCRSKDWVDIILKVTDKDLPSVYRKPKPPTRAFRSQEVRLKRFELSECKRYETMKSKIHPSNSPYGECLLQVAVKKGNFRYCRHIKNSNYFWYVNCMHHYAIRTGDLRSCTKLSPTKRSKISKGSEMHDCIVQAIYANATNKGCQFIGKLLGKESNECLKCERFLNKRLHREK